MKKTLCLAVSLLALNLTPGFAQKLTPEDQIRLIEANRVKAPPAPTKFDLDFPGGTPTELVKAIEKATGKPLNVIISSDEQSAKAKLPPIKISDMDVVRLFNTLRENSQKVDAKHHELMQSEGFFTRDSNPNYNSLWTFSVYRSPSVLTKFDLNFPGGTPAQLVEAIETASGQPLNVVIPDEDAHTELPPLKMDQVDVAQLFQALAQASIKTVLVKNNSAIPTPGRNSGYSTFTGGCGFKTEGQPTDNSIWYFYVERPTTLPPTPKEKVCHFFSLEPYLNHGFTVDDITTAIQTGWKLTGEMSLPELKYHKETKLLIVYGDLSQLAMINNVLQSLPQMAERKYESLQNLQLKIEKLQEEVAQLKSSKTVSSPASTTSGK